MVLGDDGFAAEEAAVLGDVVDFVAEAAVLGDFAVLLLALVDVVVDFNVEVVPRAEVFDAIGMSRKVVLRAVSESRARRRRRAAGGRACVRACVRARVRPRVRSARSANTEGPTGSSLRS